MDTAALRLAWDDSVLSDPSLDAAGCAALVEQQVELGASFSGRPLCTVLRPDFVTLPRLAQLERLCNAVASASMKVRRWVVAQPGWEDRLAIREGARELVALEPGFRRLAVTARLDGFEGPDGFRFVELNAEAPAGIAYHDVLARLFRRLPAFEQLGERVHFHPLQVRRKLLRALLATWERWGGQGKPRVAIVDWDDSPTSSEFGLLASFFTGRGCPTVVSDPRSLDFVGGKLWSAEGPIDLVYRRVLLMDCVQRRDEVDALVQAVAARAVCLVNPFRAGILHRKRLFAHLTDPSLPLGLTEAEQAAVDRSVPWTRVLQPGPTGWLDGQPVDLLPFVRSHREELVLKPDDDYGGRGVRVGRLETEASWDEAIQGGLGEATVVQRAVPLATERFPLMDGSRTSAPFVVDRDPYLFRGRVGGFLVRLAQGHLANVTAGGSMVPTFAVTPR